MLEVLVVTQDAGATEVSWSGDRASEKQQSSLEFKQHKLIPSKSKSNKLQGSVVVYTISIINSPLLKFVSRIPIGKGQD
jgi:hypothetical protein